MTNEHPEMGITLRDLKPLIRALRRWMVKDATLVNPVEAIPRRDRVTVYLCNHGPLFAPYPAPLLTVEWLLERGGFDDLMAVTLFHRVAEWVPGLSSVLERTFGHATTKLTSLAGVRELMQRRAFDIIGTVPEGVSCNFIYDEPVGPFTKVGLMKVALETDADIVLAGQRGVDMFGLRLGLPGGLRLPLPGNPRGFQLPWHVPGRRAHVTLRYRRYEPLISADERARLDPVAQRAQYNEEFTRIREQLIALCR